MKRKISSSSQSPSKLPLTTRFLPNKKLQEETGKKLNITSYNNIPFNISYNTNLGTKIIGFSYAIKVSSNFEKDIKKIIKSNPIYYLNYDPNSSKFLNIEYVISKINDFVSADAQDEIETSRYAEPQLVDYYFNAIDTNGNSYSSNNIDYEDHLYTDGKNYFYLNNPREIILFLNKLYKSNNYIFQLQKPEISGGSNKNMYKVYIEDKKTNKYYIKYNSKKYYLTSTNISMKNNKYYMNIDKTYLHIYI